MPAPIAFSPSLRSTKLLLAAGWILFLATSCDEPAAELAAAPVGHDAGNSDSQDESQGSDAQDGDSQDGDSQQPSPTTPPEVHSSETNDTKDPTSTGSPGGNDSDASVAPIAPTTSTPPTPESLSPEGGTAADSEALGAHPFAESPITRGGTMTFTNVGAKGSWPRRLDRDPGDPSCDYKDGEDTWGGQCCMTEYETSSEQLSPFDEEMTLILKALDIKQLAVYQPEMDDEDDWARVSDWDSRTAAANNLWFTQQGNGSAEFPGDLTHDDCVGYVMQEPSVDCAASAYACPDDPGILHQGFAGSKLIVFLASMQVQDSALSACDGDGLGHPGPWVAFVASELIRDGGRKWNGLCNCYSKTGSVGDGCGEVNVFEVVMDDNDFSNREFASTGVRSYQAGHVGGAVCTAECERDAFAPDADVVDACAGTAYEAGPELVMGGATDGCPVWRRPEGDRYFFILLDRPSRTIQVGMIHPSNIPSAVSRLLPDLPKRLLRTSIDSLVALRLPG